MKILDGKGTGFQAGVSNKHRLLTTAIFKATQAQVSIDDAQAYQVSAEQSIGTSDVPVLYLENSSNSLYLIVTYIRMQTADAAATNASAYFTTVLGNSYTSGGADLVPFNMNQTSGNAASGVFKDGSSSLTLAGGTEIDKNYQANSMQTYNKEGSVVLGRGDSITINHKGSTVAGTAYTRVSFYYIDTNEVI